MTLALMVTVASCSLLGTSGPRTAAERFLTALAQGDTAAAAATTDDPPAATTLVNAVFDGLEHPRLTTGLEEVTDEQFSYRATWDFGNGRVWSYLAHATLRQAGDGWQVHWAPSVLHDALQPGDGLQLRTLPATPGRDLDRGGAPLIQPGTVTLVRLDPARTTDPNHTLNTVAPVLSRIDPSVTRASLRSAAAGATGPVTLITLREEDAARVEPALRDVPGIVLSEQQRRLIERGLSSPALTELAKDQDTAGAGWQVVVVDTEGTVRTRLAGQDPAPPQDVTLTLDLHAQTAAQDALRRLDEPAALVAIRPSTGEILAVAQNPAADAEGPIAITGVFPPGSTFKVVTATAALDAGAVTPDTVLPCPGTENIQGRQIPNDDGFDLGSVPLHTAFAHSCNTTFARIGVGLEPTALRRTAARLGLGTDWDVPGITTVTGTVPDAATPAEQVENSIGQGRVVASPFGMAMVAATVAHGRTPSPTLIQGRPGTLTRDGGEQAPLPDQLRAELATMMRETVTDGSASQLADLPDVTGKTGTAQFGDGTRSHGWFIGTRGDLAFAVLVVGGETSRPAVDAAGRFLEATPNP
ncbi:MAG TPA: penicillin-binding transpeptidase domain-containing protein [Pseudonocardia sp.]